MSTDMPTANKINNASSSNSLSSFAGSLATQGHTKSAAPPGIVYAEEICLASLALRLKDYWQSLDGYYVHAILLSSLSSISGSSCRCCRLARQHL